MCRFLNRVWRAVGAAICSAFKRMLLATLAKLVGADPAQVASLASSSFVSSRATGSTTVSTFLRIVLLYLKYYDMLYILYN